MAQHRLRELPPVERPRERMMMLGPAALSATELLTILWGAGESDAASGALERHGSLAELGHADVIELTAVPGVGAARAAQLVAAFEIGRRSALGGAFGRWSVRAPSDVADRLL